MLKTLHINSYFLSNKIHYNFYKELIKYREDQFLIPVHKHFKSADIPSLDIDFVFNRLDRTIFVTKVWKVVRLFFKKKFPSFDYVHGHTLMSDGIPSYIISVLKNKKLVISIRNTDLTLFVTRSWLFRKVGAMILKRAKGVFFISPTLQRKIEQIYPEIDRTKFFLLPNGLDDYWVSTIVNETKRPTQLNSKLKLLFVGELVPRKNLDIIIDFLRTYTDKSYKLTVIGKNTSGVDFNAINKELPAGNSVMYQGEIKDKGLLKEAYDNNDVFVLLSHAETFGVVYIEAMSRGLPILYSQNEGMDGFFKDGDIGYACDKSSIEDLKKKINLVLINYLQISNNALIASQSFNWAKITSDYIRTTELIIKD